MASDDEKTSNASEAAEVTTSKASTNKRPVDAGPASSEAANPSKRPHRRKSTIDLADASHFVPCQPKGIETLKAVADQKAIIRKQQKELAKATKAEERKQKRLRQKATKLTNEELIEIVQQRRHIQEERRAASAAKEGASSKSKQSKSCK